MPFLFSVFSVFQQLLCIPLLCSQLCQKTGYSEGHMNNTHLVSTEPEMERLKMEKFDFGQPHISKKKEEERECYQHKASKIHLKKLYGNAFVPIVPITYAFGTTSTPLRYTHLFGTTQGSHPNICRDIPFYSRKSIKTQSLLKGRL